MVILFSSIILAGAAVWFLWERLRHRKRLRQIVSLEQRCNGLKNNIAMLKANIGDIAGQKAGIEKESANITTSILYAEKIQRSLIPSVDRVKRAFWNSFVYFAPKDIVSGDFYMMQELKNYTVVVVADCTGHGVPGGFLSMLGMAGLKDILPQYHEEERIPTGAILTRLRRFVMASLSETIETEGDGAMSVSDGMDMTLVAFNKTRTMMTFSLADHCLFLWRDGALEKLKGDRMPIGRHPNQDQAFMERSLVLKPNDMVYLCSDGIQDQLGGPDNSKFMTKRLSRLLEENAPLDTETQFRNITNVVNNWKLGFDQVDDQTLIGIRIEPIN